MTIYTVGTAENSLEAIAVDTSNNVETNYKCAIYPNFSEAKQALLDIVSMHGMKLINASAPMDVLNRHAALTFAVLDMREEYLAGETMFSAESENVWAYFLLRGELPEDDGIAHFELVADHRNCKDGLCLHQSKESMN